MSEQTPQEAAEESTPTEAAEHEAAEEEPEAEPAWKRRRRLDEVFGDQRHTRGLGDDWYRDQVPPHHG